jgi:myo-inositol-1(or 4)-monophosphatase
VIVAEQDPPEPAALERIAVDLAEGAADVVRQSRDRDVIAAKSSATDLVTEVDRRTEAWLVAEIGRRRPGDAVLGEEDGSHRGSTAVRWVIDPIDGTVNFVLGLPQYAVSVAAEIDGVVVAGAVSNPATGETFHAHRGGGAWLDGQRLTGPRDVPLSRAVIATGFSYDATERARQVAIAGPLLPRIADLRRLGSAALDLCFVAAGRLDGYFEAGLNRWDYAAGALIAQEAGAIVAGPPDEAPSSRLVVAAGASLAGDLLAALGAAGAARP